MTFMNTNTLYLNNIFNDVLAYFGKSYKEFEQSSLISHQRNLFHITCEYVKENWKGVKLKYVFTVDLHEMPDGRVLFMLTNDRDVPQHYKAIRITPGDKDKDIMWDIITFCELNEIDFN